MADRYNIALKEIPLLPLTDIEEMEEEEIKVKKTTRKSSLLGLQSPSGLIIWVPIEKVRVSYDTKARELTNRCSG